MNSLKPSSTFKLIALALALGCLNLATGCKKKEANTQQPMPGVSAETQATLTELTTAARKYAQEKRQIPMTLDEVVAAGYLKEVPAAPEGKKFMLDSRRVIVMLVDK